MTDHNLWRSMLLFWRNSSGDQDLPDFTSLDPKFLGSSKNSARLLLPGVEWNDAQFILTLINFKI